MDYQEPETIESIDRYVLPSPVLLELSSHMKCGGCGRPIDGSRRGYFHENKREPYHWKCGWKFSRRIGNKKPHEVGLTAVTFLHREGI